ncbi:uncharacterized protein LOC121863616 [Homarus americanus]|uniref:uncharacterized protein LOC121863616 n=1 Tax=Homarus americanus TaxID=6706 RepID=UPI001C4469B5|nr:uncharacterized protein LOC121863616 [Homarus americanus]XP_042218289.1 uncharacterized protein LOC121863616 [Homarus americanus]
MVVFGVGDSCQHLGRNITTLLAPVAWLGALLGVFPYSRRRATIDPGESLADSPSSLIQAETDKEARERAAPTSPHSADPPYRFVFWSFRSTIVAVWLSLVLLGYFPMMFTMEQEPVTDTEGTGILHSLSYTSWFSLIVMYFGWWAVISHRREFESHLAAMEKYPTAFRDNRSCLVLMLGLIFFLFNLVLQMDVTRRALPAKDIPTLFFYMGMAAHFSGMENVMISVLWVLLAHHTHQLHSANATLSYALQSSDLCCLQTSRKLVMQARGLCNGTEDLMKTGIMPQLLRTSTYLCYSLAIGYLSLEQPQVAVMWENTWIRYTLVLIAIIQFIFTFFLGHQCYMAGNATIHLLQGKGEGHDQYSREVSGIRRDLLTAPLVFTVNDFINLTLPNLWNLLQFLITQVVILVQFTQYDLDSPLVEATSNTTTTI